MSSRRKHTSPKNGGERSGGSRPQAHTWVRQIVAASMCHVDRQIVAWAVAQGHRHKPVDNLKYFSRCHIYALLLWEIVGCQFNNNGGKYGITIRLHSLGHRRLGQRPAQRSCKLCLGDDVHRHAKGYSGECGRNYFSSRISSKNKSWSMDQEISSSAGQSQSTGHDWLQNQCEGGASLQIHPKMDENCRARAAGILRSKIGSTSNPGRDPAWVFLYPNKKINKIRPQAHN